MPIKVEVVNSKSNKEVATVFLNDTDNIADLKRAIHKQRSKFYPDRQMLRAEPSNNIAEVYGIVNLLFFYY